MTYKSIKRYKRTKKWHRNRIRHKKTNEDIKRHEETKSDIKRQRDIMLHKDTKQSYRNIDF